MGPLRFNDGPIRRSLWDRLKHPPCGVHCRAQNIAFMECKSRDSHPAACLKQGEQVTKCALALFTKLSACQQKLQDFSNCLDKNHNKLAKCRPQQLSFNECADATLN